MKKNDAAERCDKSSPEIAPSAGRNIVSESWTQYYRKRKGQIEDGQNYWQMTSYNAYFLNKVQDEIRRRIAKDGPVVIWSAGSGIDPVSMNIKATFKNDVELTLSDTSEDCILANREAFANHGLAARFLTGDLFDSEFNEEFDIVINTGLLEHFEPTDAERLLRRISQSLRPDGTYMTLVPYADGRLYRLCMARMKKKGTWELGPEKPLSTFKNLRSDQLVLVEERPIDALFQLSFVPSAFPGMGSIALPAIVLMKNAPRVFEPIFMRVMSGYALYGKFVKISRAPKE